MSESALKRVFGAGYVAGITASRRDEEDVPVMQLFENFVEQHGLPTVGLTKEDNFRLREAEEHIAGAIQLLRVHQIHLTQILARVVKDEPPTQEEENA